MPHAQTKLTILVVSNDQRLARVLEREIGSRGHIAITAPNGGQPMPSTTDLVIIDSNLDGRNTNSVAKNLLGNRSTAILMLAGSREEVKKAQSEGVDIQGHLLKPFSARDLWTSIGQCLETQGAHGTARSEIALIAAGIEQRALDDTLSRAAQLAMRWMDCGTAKAYEKVAELAAARAEQLRNRVAVAA